MLGLSFALPCSVPPVCRLCLSHYAPVFDAKQSGFDLPVEHQKGEKREYQSAHGDERDDEPELSLQTAHEVQQAGLPVSVDGRVVLNDC